MDTRAKALEAIPFLVSAAEQRETMTYKELGTKIGMHHRPVRYVLGYVRDEILVPRSLPLLNCLVVNADSRIPGESWLPAGEHLADTDAERKQQFEDFRDLVFDHPDWRSLLDELGLQPAPASNEELKAAAMEAASRSWRGGGGESQRHSRLKHYVEQNPEALGLVAAASYLEHTLLSGDRVDVAFELQDGWAMAEIKTGALGELVRGVYQGVKYRAVAEAQYGIPAKAYLVSYSMPPEVAVLAQEFGVRPVIIDEADVLTSAD